MDEKLTEAQLAACHEHFREERERMATEIERKTLQIATALGVLTREKAALGLRTAELLDIDIKYGSDSACMCYMCAKFQSDDRRKSCFACGKTFCSTCIYEHAPRNPYGITAVHRLSSTSARTGKLLGPSTDVEGDATLICKECVDAGKWTCQMCNRVAITWDEDWYREFFHPYRLACKDCRATHTRTSHTRIKARYVLYDSWCTPSCTDKCYCGAEKEQQLEEDEDDSEENATGPRTRPVRRYRRVCVCEDENDGDVPEGVPTLRERFAPPRVDGAESD
jgi:hypothetical protein